MVIESIINHYVCCISSYHSLSLSDTVFVVSLSRLDSENLDGRDIGQRDPWLDRWLD